VYDALRLGDIAARQGQPCTFTFVTEFSPASLPAQAVRMFAGIFNEPDEPLFNVVPLYDWEASSLNILNEVSRGKLDGTAILADHCQYAPSDGGMRRHGMRRSGTSLHAKRLRATR
jgi:hypothetical protein